VDASATIAGGTLPLLPYLFAPVYTAMLIAVGLVTVSVFGLGFYLGSLSRQNIYFSALKMAALALSISAIVYIVQKLIVPPGGSV